MKQRIFVFTFLLGLLASHQSAFAVKIGIVDMQRIILNVEEGKVARDKLQAEIKEKETALQKQKEELDKLNEDWKNQSALLSEEARTRKQAEFQEKFMKLRNEEMQFQQSIKQKEAQETQKIAMKVSAHAELLAKEKDLDVVYEASSSGIMYAKNPVDLTDELIKLYPAAVGPKISKNEKK